MGYVTESCRKASRWTRVLGVAAVTAALGLLSAPALGQNTCNPALGIALLPSAAQYAVGQQVTVTVTFGTGSINGGTAGSISDLTVLLDCASGGSLCAVGCSDPTNPYVSYNGDGSIVHNTNCGGAHSVASNNPGGGTSVNPLNFHFTPAISLPPNSTCQLSFVVTLLDLGGLNSKLIRGRVVVSGTCNTSPPLDLFGCSTYSYEVVQPRIHIVKTANPTSACQGDSITYTYHVTNPGSVPVAVDRHNPSNPSDLNGVVDDNGTPGNTADDFSPVYQSGDTSNPGFVDPGEDWVFTATRNPPVGTTHNIAVVTGTFVSGGVTTTVTDDDDETVVIHPLPSCSITPTPGACQTTYTANTDACLPATFAWTGPGGFTANTQSITLNASSTAGEYCVTVTDCNGCTNPESCCVNFTPPPGLTCSIAASLCPYPVTLTAVPSGGTNFTYQWGTGTCSTTCTPLAGETNPTLIVNADGDYCVTITDTDTGCTACCNFNVACVIGEGCTPGYWKQCQHFSDWVCPYCPQAPGINCLNQGVAHLGCGSCSAATTWTGAGFDNAFRVSCSGASKTLLTVLSQSGSSYPSGCGSSALNALGRHTVAALLNSAKLGTSYSSTYSTPAAVVAAFNAVYPGTDAEYLALKNVFAALNEQGCPLNGHSDLNGDGRVNQTDLDLLLANWGHAGIGDVNRDGIVNTSDVAILMSWWGS